jgi:hypothetical protein
VVKCYDVWEDRTASFFRMTDLFQMDAKDMQRKEACQSGQTYMQKSTARVNLGRAAWCSYRVFSDSRYLTITFFFCCI